MDAGKYNFDGYAIGEQDFRSLRESNSLYVDKTRYIQKIVESRSKYYFLARPRRFGKSLFLSTLCYFFQGERELFHDLHIESIEWDWIKYPVLYLDLNARGFESTGSYTESTDSDKLDFILEYMLEKWEKEFEVERTMDDLVSRFRKVIETAHEKTGRQVVILVDEYDKPLVHNLDNDLSFEHYRSKLSDLYANFKTCAGHIRLVFLTGVSRFSKLSVFSALNNLKDITFADEFADICGITENELLTYFQTGIQRLADKRKIPFTEALTLLKKNYDGYKFAEEGSDIYNPWSILNAMDFGKIANYWNFTGLPTVIVQSLKRSHSNLEKAFNAICDLNDLMGLDLKSGKSLALLFQTGYLTIKHYDSVLEVFTLGIPNLEVRKGIMDTLLPYYVSVRNGEEMRVVRDILDNIMHGQPEELMNALRVFFAGIPYELKMDDENNIQNALYILMSLLGMNVEAEARTSDGRIDLLIKTPAYIYVIELKYDSTSDDALRQIEEKHYDLPYSRDGRRIFMIGANFSSKTRTLDTPAIKTLP